MHSIISSKERYIQQSSEILEDDNRLQIENGYKFVTLPVEYAENGQQVVALTCIAEQQNEYFLGPASISVMAKQIATARGKAGPNYE